MFGSRLTVPSLLLRPATIVLILGALFLTSMATRAAAADIPLLGDLDGDGKADLIMWQAGTAGQFRWVLSSAAYSDVAAGTKQWGTVVGGVQDVPLIADIDGDGKGDLIVWRPSTATFYWLTSSSGYSASGSRQWGDPQQPDVPLVGDIDGDGKADLAVWRRGNGTFYWLTSSTGYSYAIGAQGSKQWGGTVNGVADIPLLKDLDGDGKADLVYWRPATATFYWLTSSSAYSTNAARSRQWGDYQQPDVPLLGDIDGDRKADLFVWRQGNGTFYWLTSSTGYSYALGAQGADQWGGVVNGVPDVPLLGDIDGDGKTDLLFARPATGEFHWVTSSTGYSSAAAGAYYPPSANLPPVVSAGSNQSITLPVWASLTGTVSDDGLPRGGGVTQSWSKVSGPGAVTFGNLNAPSTTAGFSVAGAYVLRLTATDGALSAYANVAITVNAANQAPIVSAGPNQTITFPASATLNGTATDDGLPAGSTLTRAWSKASGPGTVTFGNVNAQSTTASFSVAGTYVLRLTVSDGALSAYADVTITVNAASGCSGVTVPSTTTDVQAVVSAYPEGTTFCFQPVTYRLAGPVLARSGDRFVGQPGTVLDGQNTVAKGIWGYGGLSGQSGVTVQGLTLANFTDTAVVTGWSWTVQQNDIHHSLVGVAVNSNTTLDSNYIHDNRRYGVSGGPGTDIIIVNNELARNNTDNSCGGACVGDAGGSKIIGSATGTTGLVWRNNNVHDNTGHGIWSDGNVRALYEGNVVSNNSGSGIFHEISWDSIIRNNTLTNNDSDNIGQSCWWGANILVNTSSNVEVYGNTITANNGSNGICAVSADRSDAVAPYPTVVANFYAHDNAVYMTASAISGLAKGTRTGDINNRFVNNTYALPILTRAWWTSPTVPTATWSTWQASGQDAGGRLTTW
jgi:parallel beta-helix repeat protein